MNSIENLKISSKNIKIIALAVTLLLVIFGWVKSLTKSTEKKIVGTWICTTDEEWTLTFKENGKFYDSDSYFLYYTKVGTWTIPSDGILYLDSEGDDDTFEFELKGNMLTIYVENSRNPSYSFRRSK